METCILPGSVGIGRSGTEGMRRMATATATGVRAADGMPATGTSHAAPRRHGRFSRGHLLMATAGIVGVVLSFAVLRAREGETAALVAAHEIRAGETITASDFRATRVTLTPEVLATVARVDDRARLGGRIAGSTIAAGELVTTRTLRRRAAPHGLRAMSIPIDPARAVGGRLAAGDRVDVLFAGQQAVSIIVADAPVLAAAAGSASRRVRSRSRSASPRGSRNSSLPQSPTGRSRSPARPAPSPRAASHPS